MLMFYMVEIFSIICWTKCIKPVDFNDDKYMIDYYNVQLYYEFSWSLIPVGYSNDFNLMVERHKSFSERIKFCLKFSNL